MLFPVLVGKHLTFNEDAILVSMNYVDSDMSKSTNTVVYFDWKTFIYIYVCGQGRTQFMLLQTNERLIRQNLISACAVHF
jgi:hypothetical protein